MKKIVALVLSLVMALSLCTVAFAAIPTWTENESKSLDLFDPTYNTKLNETDTAAVFTYTAAKAASKGVVGHIGYWKAPGYDPCYVLSTTWNEDVTYAIKAHDNTIKKGDQTTKDNMYYLTAVGAISYTYTATLFTDWGTLCGQYAKPDNADSVDYVKYTDWNGKVHIRALAANASEADPSVNVLIDGFVYTMTGDDLKTIGHNWLASKLDKNGKVEEYTCATCKTVAKVYPSVNAVPAGLTIERMGDGTIIAFSYTVGTPGKTNTSGVNSAKTFDAGVAMYVGMSLLSVAGGAVVIGKKKEF